MANLPPSVRELYPFSQHTHVTSRGARMNYVDEGPKDADAVLLLHGNPTWSFFYRDVIGALSSRLRCIAPDHIGMGLSEKPEDYPYTLQQRIDDVVSLLDKLGLTRCHLVVHDWGGAIGMGVATAHPERIGRIVILNTAAFVSSDIPWTINLCRVPWIGPWLVRALNGFAWPATWMAMSHRSLTAGEKAGYLLPYDSWKHRVAVSAFVQDIPLEPEHPSRATLRKIEEGLGALANHPKCLIWGGRDFCFHDGFLARWHAFFPDAPIHRLAHSGHYVLDDSDGVATALIVEFLTRSGAPRLVAGWRTE